MKYLVFSICTFFAINTFAQTNDSDPSMYQWKGKKTVMKLGYVVLKSGKKVDGRIQLNGSADDLSGITILTNGREIDLPLASLTSYGLSVGGSGNSGSSRPSGPVTLREDATFVWGAGAEVMGKFQQVTKKRAGYVVLPDGKKLSGDLTLKKLDDEFAQLILKTDKKKYKFTPSEVRDYGAAFTIADITNGGKKKFNDAGRNFYPGTVVMTDNSKKDGIIAFSKRQLVNPNNSNRGHKYSGVYYTPDKVTIISTIPEADVFEIVRNENGVNVTYQYYEGFFLDQTTFDRAFSDPTRSFNQGDITLLTGESMRGDIAQQKLGGAFYGRKVLVKDDNGRITSYLPEAVLSFTQMIEGQKKTFIPEQGTFVELEFDGKVFSYFRNPFSTTTNKFMTGLVSSGVNLGTAVATGALINKDQEVNDYESNMMETIQAASEEELQIMQDQLSAASESGTNNAQSESIGRYQAAIAARQVGMATDNALEEGGGLKKKEWIIYNKKSGEKTMVVRSEFKKRIEPVLKGCFDYLSMDKSAQRKMDDFNNVMNTLKMIDNCY